MNTQDINNLDAIMTSDSQYHVLKDNRSFKVEIIEGNFDRKRYKVKVNNNIYNIQINNNLDLLIKQMGFEAGSSRFINEIKAPMPGLVLDIPIKIGDQVNENDILLILEAMKMENALSSPRAGIIKSIVVEKGQAVDKGQLLIEFE
ncbi:MAG TPA: acetyl-CoA carboxylase biotin carboxyl carrier protein subunit [Aquaticitalea sp.]|nr:acetyl-CoA carboxylase biotin carboxyl carrier protein subunit [Aquaticitalea sp.]HNU59616.1 acetyl-CoA carboxylase biotin carboxyl carrier protein subunit [Aquaticitalea sp.]